MACNHQPVILSDRFANAFAYTLSLHRHQCRKLRRTPYMAHLMSVAALVLEDGGSEAEAIAALLHDAVEDQGGEPIRTQIRHRYGDFILALVDACTEPQRQPQQSWRDHKLSYLNQVQYASTPAQRIILADKLHNLRSLLVNWQQFGNAIWLQFLGQPLDYLWFYRRLIESLNAQSQSPMLIELKAQTAELTEAIKLANPLPP